MWGAGRQDHRAGRQGGHLITVGRFNGWSFLYGGSPKKVLPLFQGNSSPLPIKRQQKLKEAVGPGGKRQKARLIIRSISEKKQRPRPDKILVGKVLGQQLTIMAEPPGIPKPQRLATIVEESQED